MFRWNSPFLTRWLFQVQRNHRDLLKKLKKFQLSKEISREKNNLRSYDEISNVCDVKKLFKEILFSISSSRGEWKPYFRQMTNMNSNGRIMTRLLASCKGDIISHYFLIIARKIEAVGCEFLFGFNKNYVNHKILAKMFLVKDCNLLFLFSIF